MKDPFEAFGALARSDASVTLKAGRRNMQAEAESFIPEDIVQKLSLTSGQSLLEIGCGPATILKELAPYVFRTVGIDHTDVIAVAKEQCKSTGIVFIAGAFPETRLNETFDRILMYSVIQYQANLAGAFRFVDAALALLNPMGKLLIGDIPNADRTRRFRESEEGKKFEMEWAARKGIELATYEDPFTLFADAVTLGFDDARIDEFISHYRKRGYQVSTLPQSHKLPYGYTREDMLIQSL
ncbi:TPA: hypothetical protein DIV48_01185 [Candidatus Kaiserbacteria bacterium]|nr:MAG: hypothetical protein UY93_C0002G0030 [Parcubacteria group bacterium GW2011_GWA1_56_13]KKW46318.1 MAG: hypothetical protein UY97_C0007G0029 [Parcubacteria group bacterium GW2011_GWB1_57_6]HCR52245.1 hypothetical protein [Candidatus Kaiserbacteria bacterium]